MTTLPFSGSRSIRVRSITEFDVVLGTPTGYTGGAVPISVNTVALGDLIATTSGSFTNSGVALTATVGIGTGGSILSSVSDLATVSAGSSGALSALLTTSDIFVLPGSSITVRMELNGSISASSFRGGSAAGAISASNTFSLVKSGDVFNVPTGFTVNSEDGVTVVNNRFGGNTLAPVPLSGAFGMTMLALSAFGGMRLRQCKRRS